MSAIEWAAIVSAAGVVMAGIAAIYAQVRRTHTLVNSRMDELIALTAKSSRAEGMLAGRKVDPVERLLDPPPAGTVD